MIQFNLLPEIKREYERARRNKRLTFLIATVIAIVALVVLGIMFAVVQGFQKGYSNDLSTDIKTQSSKLQNTEDVSKILTIQNQLDSLTGLHEAKPVATRLLDYIKQLTPSRVSLATLDVDFQAQTMKLTGTGDNLALINQFIDTLKFTTYQAGGTDGTESKTGNAFSEVVLSNFVKSVNDSATYQISLKYDPVIFAGDGDVELIIPAGKITTRSQTEKPDPIFQEQTQGEIQSGGVQ